MTIKEAVVIAMQEIGMTDEEIDHRRKHADLNIGAEAGNANIIPGCEREVIENCKTLFALINSSEGFRKQVHDESIRKASEFHENN